MWDKTWYELSNKVWYYFKGIEVLPFHFQHNAGYVAWNKQKADGRDFETDNEVCILMSQILKED